MLGKFDRGQRVMCVRVEADNILGYQDFEPPQYEFIVEKEGVFVASERHEGAGRFYPLSRVHLIDYEWETS